MSGSGCMKRCGGRCRKLESKALTKILQLALWRICGSFFPQPPDLNTPKIQGCPSIAS